MAYPTCKIKNISGEAKELYSKSFTVGEIYQILDGERISWGMNDDVGDAIITGDFEIHDADGAISGYMAQIAHLQNY